MGFIIYFIFAIFAIGLVCYINYKGEWFIMEIIWGLIFGIFIGIIVGLQIRDY